MRNRLANGDEAGAQALCLKIIEADTNNQEAKQTLHQIQHSRMVKERFPGMNYLEWLEWFHTMLKPETYLEIGVESGRSLQYARSPTRAVELIPPCVLSIARQPGANFLRKPAMIFSLQDIAQVLGKPSIDFAFIDGLHTFDQALRDFINIERNSCHQTVVLFHDIFRQLLKPRSANGKLFSGSVTHGR